MFKLFLLLSNHCLLAAVETEFLLKPELSESRLLTILGTLTAFVPAFIELDRSRDDLVGFWYIGKLAANSAAETFSTSISALVDIRDLGVFVAGERDWLIKVVTFTLAVAATLLV